MEKGNEKAALALDVFCYNVKKYIGAYAAVLNGVDLIIFTGGIGENDNLVRWETCKNMDYLGIQVDKRTKSGEKIRSSAQNNRLPR